MAARTGLSQLVPGARDWQSAPVEELIHACVNSGELPAWEEFVARVHPLIAVTVLRTVRRWGGAPDTVVEDLIQETYLKICANRCQVLTTFQAESQNSIFGFIKTVTANLVHDYFRSVNAVIHGGGKADVPLEDAYAGDPCPSGRLSPTERQILLRQIEDFLSRMNLKPLECQVFWLYYRQGLTTRAIAEIPDIGLTQKGIESTIHRLTVRVREWLAEKNSHQTGVSTGKSS